MISSWRAKSRLCCERGTKSALGAGPMAERVPLSQTSRVFVAGHRGLVGSAIVRRLEAMGCRDVLGRKRSELDLCDPAAVNRFFLESRPEFVFLSAARTGGILANSIRPAEFLYDNLAI